MNEMILKISLSMLIGGLIGIEREYRDKDAGIRTIMLICLGTTIFTMLSVTFMTGADPSRIAAAIVTGIGFLGGGAIIRERFHVKGLTTAATIWLVSALGLAVGMGEYQIAVITMPFVLFILWILPKFEKVLAKRHYNHAYNLQFKNGAEKLDLILKVIIENDLKIISKRINKHSNCYSLDIKLSGKLEHHESFAQKMRDDELVTDFEMG